MDPEVRELARDLLMMVGWLVVEGAIGLSLGVIYLIDHWR
jgi:hypothetical protein